MNWKVISLLIVLFVAGVLIMVVKRNLSPATEKISVFGEDSSNLKAYSLLKDDFKTAAGIHVDFEGATFEQAVQKADADFRNGRGHYDVVLQYNFSLAPYVKNHYVAEIADVFSPTALKDSRINDGIFENALYETCYYYSDPSDTRSTPKQFGFPFAANTMLLAYNLDLFEDQALQATFRTETGRELRVPTTWDDYLVEGEFFARARADVKGVCLQGAGDGWLYYELCNYLFSLGTGTSRKRYGWEEGALLSIATPENEEALRYYKRLRGVSSGDFFTVGAAQQQEIMLQGKTAMALVWSDYVQPLAASKSPRFGFAPIPGKVSGLAGGAFYINRRSHHIPASAQFVLYALTADNQAKLIEKGLCSPLKTAYTDDVMARVPYTRALRDSLERGIFMFEAGSDAEAINSALTTWVQKFIRGEISESEALRRAQAEVTAQRKNEK